MPRGPLRPTDAATTPFQPVKAGNAFEEVVEQVLDAVKSGRVQPGDQLPPERELALQLHVSRVTLREAIRALAQAGYVESRRGRSGGTFVVYEHGKTSRSWPRRPGTEQLEDVIAFRRIVEGAAVDTVTARRLGPAERKLLEAALEEVQEASLGEYRQADTRLHLLIVELAGSALLTRAVADMRMRVNDLLDALPVLEQPLVYSNAQHTELVSAILAGDSAGARVAIEEHLEATAALLRGFLT
jgi:DNA-binding FadR family transcriptional regulator